MSKTVKFTFVLFILLAVCLRADAQLTISGNPPLPIAYGGTGVTTAFNMNAVDANTIGIYSGATSQEVQIYNFHTSSTNFERGRMYWNSNVYTITADKGGGGGSQRDIEIGPWHFNLSTGALTPNSDGFAFGTGSGPFRPAIVAASLITPTYASTTNCSDSAGAAACVAAPSGSVVIDAAATAVVVSTTAVTANSQIFVQDDSGLGTRLAVTCNTQALTVLGTPRVTARTASTSFTITIDVGPTTNPLCLSYFIIN